MTSFNYQIQSKVIKFIIDDYRLYYDFNFLISKYKKLLFDKLLL